MNVTSALRGFTVPEDAPQGTLALVFTDIEGSTRLWEALGHAFRPVLQLHDRVLRSAIGNWRGYEVKTEGDAFFVVFTSTLDAVGFCLEVQDALFRADWPDAVLALPEANVEPGFRGLRVRMGVHVGVPISTRDPTTGRADYLGPVVNRAARVSAQGRGGQIVLSDAAFAAVRETLPLGTRVADLGVRTLKGLDRPEHLWEVLPASLAARRFGGSAVEGRRTNLPVGSSSFVGRDEERARLDGCLAVPGNVVVVVGPAGVGKSALATQVVRHSAHPFPGGVWRIGLAAVRNRDELDRVAARSLAVSGESPFDALVDSLVARGATLLLLDDADFVAKMLPEWVADVQASAPHVTVIVTARTPLACGTTLALGPMPTDEGVELYRRRAGEAGARAPVAADVTTPWEAEVRELVEDLDGLPLSIELAAAHARVAGPATVRARVARHQHLVSAATGVDPRHASVEAALAWTWELLRESDRAALGQLAVFEHAFPLAQAEALLVAVGGDLGSVTRLVAQGVLQQGADERLVMLRAVRAFALSRTEPAARTAAFRRHATLLASWGTFETTEQLYGPDALARHEALADDAPEVLLALRRTLDAGDADLAGALAIGASEVLHIRGPVRAALYAYDRLLDGDLRVADGRPRLMLYRARGWARTATPDLEGARVDFEAGLRLADAVEDGVLGARLCGDLATALAQLGDDEGARLRYGESIRRAMDAGDDAAAIASRANLAMLLRGRGQTQEALLLLGAATRIAARGRQPVRGAQVAGVLGMVRMETGDLEGAEEALTAAVDHAARMGNAYTEAEARCERAIVRLERGDAAAARRDADEAVRLTDASGWSVRLPLILAVAVHARALDGDPDGALRALARVDATLPLLRDPATRADSLGHVILALSHMGRSEEARHRAELASEHASRVLHRARSRLLA